MARNKSAAPAWEAGVNPFRRHQAGHVNVEPCTVVIFGASGDLTGRKLLPALFNLVAEGALTAPLAIVGFARRDQSDDSFRVKMREDLAEFSRTRPEQYAGLDSFLGSITYHRGSFDQQEDFVSLKRRLNELELKRGGPHNRLYYLATPPESFPEIIRQLKSAGLAGSELEASGWNRIIIEKPYGRDLASAWTLTGAVHSAFSEKQVYRIDHYLGKETVQNILAFRLGNGIFEPIWNRTYVDHVQITVSETLGLENRAGYFDKAGIARDMLQSHILQLFSLIAMEPPVAFDASHIHDEKAKVLRSVRHPDLSDMSRFLVRAQYREGSVGGQKVPSYRDEPGVEPSSMTETYLAIKLEIDNWRWAGVPFYIRTGKRLAKKISEVDIIFREPPHRIFTQAGTEKIHANVLGIKIQPEEGISLSVGCKRPGQFYDISPVNMEFNYATSFGVASPEAYERLLLDAILGDSTLFARADEVELSWELLDPIITAWKNEPGYPLAFYEAGSWGPAEAAALMTRGGREWHRL
jgi:glucose-6-phosphate 1-dehydrogenase